ncbi:hypothetical protein P8452_52323 [Trifolium repens]|nr:hypothetical protein QL285_074110 [Trifolium repens]WJX61083.1 hypothetical protein P8452_46214 [Trifolium repens]WJX67896.1 hypothetical protein P8452_52323 [Trifolium repens]
MSSLYGHKIRYVRRTLITWKMVQIADRDSDGRDVIAIGDHVFLNLADRRTFVGVLENMTDAGFGLENG